MRAGEGLTDELYSRAAESRAGGVARAKAPSTRGREARRKATNPHRRVAGRTSPAPLARTLEAKPGNVLKRRLPTGLCPPSWSGGGPDIRAAEQSCTAPPRGIGIRQGGAFYPSIALGARFGATVTLPGREVRRMGQSRLEHRPHSRPALFDADPGGEPSRASARTGAAGGRGDPSSVCGATGRLARRVDDALSRYHANTSANLHMRDKAHSEPPGLRMDTGSKYAPGAGGLPRGNRRPAYVNTGAARADR
ncbi:hypothetical protein ACPA9J_27200 [Pseudomonas aeruginosa]